MRIGTMARRSGLGLVIALAAAPLFATASYAASAPATPSNVALTSGNRLLGVSWTETSTGMITYTATATAAGHSTHKCRTMRLHCNITSLVNGVTYNVSVVAANSSGKSAPSAPVSLTAGVPGPPLSVHATALKSSAFVKWAPPLASGVSAITGYTATANPGAFTCTTKGARSCTITGLTKGTTYTITVTATNKYGTGPSSKGFKVTSK